MQKHTECDSVIPTQWNMSLSCNKLHEHAANDSSPVTRRRGLKEFALRARFADVPGQRDPRVIDACSKPAGSRGPGSSTCMRRFTALPCQPCATYWPVPIAAGIHTIVMSLPLSPLTGQPIHTSGPASSPL